MKKHVRQRLISFLLACVMVLGLCPAALAADPADHVIINQVYGGGGKGDTPFSYSFIELYNPTDDMVELDGYQLHYSSNRDQSKKAHAGSTTPVGGETQTVTLELSGSIPAHTSFLVRCAEETTDVAKYTLSTADRDWEQVIDNDQTVVLTLTKGATYVDGVSTRTGGALTEEGGTLATEDISKQKSVRRVEFTDTDNNGADFELLIWNSETVDSVFIAANRPHSLADGAWPAEEGDVGFAADSLTLQPGATQSSVNLNWYAPAGTTAACVKFGDETVEAAVSALHTPTKLDTGKYTDTGKLSCKATVSGLRADTEYTYQISNDGGVTWSQEYTYTTPATDSFTFAFTSDPQIKENGEQNGKKPADADGGWDPDPANNQTGWAKMMEVIADAGATLVVSAGDQVEDQNWGKSIEYEAFFAPEELTTIAYAPAVGNHDRHYMFADHFNLPNEMAVAEDGTEGGEDELTQVQTSFCAQNNGDSSSHGNHILKNGSTEDYPERREMEAQGNYYYLYNNVLFITLNTGAYPGGNDPESEGVKNATAAMKDNSEAEAIVANFRKTIDAAKAEYAGEYDWIIVAHHKSTQTVAKHAADSDIENYVDAGFERLMAEEGVDFVLGGHDHVYSHSYVLDGNGDRAGERLDTIHDPEGVIYITGNCCSDMQYYTPFVELDKANNADYPRLANGETGSAAYLAGNLPVGNQEWNQEYSPCYVLFTVEGSTITATAYNLDGSSKNPDSKAIDAFTVTKDADGGSKAGGFENGNAALDVTQVGRYDAGMTNADGGVLEIVDYNAATGWAYAVNGQSGVLTAIPLDADKSGLTVSSKVDLLDGYDIDVKALVEDADFVYGDMTSVAVSPDGKTLAAAIQAEDYTAKGRVALFTCNADGTLTFVRAVETGVQPDMVTFTPDGTKILTANEGEPRMGYSASGAADPAGSVTIIDADTFDARTVGFEAFDTEDARAELVSRGIVLKKNTAPSVDLEPEYVACTNDTAYVTCQEANAIAVLDLSSGTFTGIYSVGFEDYSTVPIDLGNGDDVYAPQTYENLKGIRMPDAVSLYQANSATYLLTANEGDSRAWADEKGDNCNEYKNKTSLNGKSFEKKVTWFNASQYDGLEASVDYLFGGRSFTVLKVTADGLAEVFDSGSDFEAKTAAYLPDYFNCSNDELAMEDRSGKKGPEPETVTVGTVSGKTYAFVTLERIGGVMVYDVTNPEKASYVNYINSRDFSETLGADDSPEGLKFVPASKSPTGKALLLAACEVGGTVAVYELTAPTQNSSGGSSGSGAVTYAVTVDSTKNGTVAAAPKTAARGDTVTLTVTPDKGYALETLTVTDGSGKAVAVTEKNGKYTFVMPASKVTVKATFMEDNSMLNFFVDVPASAYYYDAVLWAAEKGITGGTDATHFSPNATCTRAQAVTFLWRAAGSPVVNYAMNFTDVPADAYYAEAVRWAVSQGITRGTTDTAFSPNATCSRAQIVTFLWRSQKSPAAGTVNPFTDVAADAYYEAAVLWAAENNVTGGTSATTFSPASNCTRAQIVTFLWRAFVE